MRTSRGINEQEGFRYYAKSLEVSEEFRVSVLVIVFQRWNGAEYDCEYRGVDWNGCCQLMDVPFDLCRHANFEQLKAKIDAVAKSVYEDEYSGVMADE